MIIAILLLLLGIVLIMAGFTLVRAFTGERFFLGLWLVAFISYVLGMLYFILK